jgi:hypothetical protein
MEQRMIWPVDVGSGQSGAGISCAAGELAVARPHCRVSSSGFHMELTLRPMENCNCFFLAVLRVALRALHLLGRHSTTWTMQPTLCALVIFKIVSCFMPGPVWTVILPYYASWVAGRTDVHHHTQLLVEIESCRLFALADLQLWSSWSPPFE